MRYLIGILLFFLPPSRLFALRRSLLRLAGVRLGPATRCCGGGWIYGRGSLRMGDRTWLSPGVIIHTHPDAPIEIGSNCDIGPRAVLVTGSHRIGPADRRAGDGIAKAIRVGDGVWIGAGAIILGGVAIGDGAVIGAGAVVTENIPPNVLAAGVPAQIKRDLPE